MGDWKTDDDWRALVESIIKEKRKRDGGSGQVDEKEVRGGAKKPKLGMTGRAGGAASSSVAGGGGPVNNRGGAAAGNSAQRKESMFGNVKEVEEVPIDSKHYTIGGKKVKVEVGSWQVDGKKKKWLCVKIDGKEFDTMEGFHNRYLPSTVERAAGDKSFYTNMTKGKFVDGDKGDLGTRISVKEISPSGGAKNITEFVTDYADKNSLDYQGWSGNTRILYERDMVLDLFKDKGLYL